MRGSTPLFLPVHDTGILGMRGAISVVYTIVEKDMMITNRWQRRVLTKSSVHVCSLQLPITELSHFRCLVAVDIVVGDRSNRGEIPSLRFEAMVIVIKEGK